MTQQAEISTALLVRSLGIPRPTLQSWIRAGHVRTSVEREGGRGVKHLFSRDDLHRLCLFLVLTESGFSPKDASDLSNSDDLEFDNPDKAFILIKREIHCPNVKDSKGKTRPAEDAYTPGLIWTYSKKTTWKAVGGLTAITCIDLRGIRKTAESLIDHRDGEKKRKKRRPKPEKRESLE